MIYWRSGDFWEQPAEIRINTVNCVGVMGKGVALQFRQRYPVMFEHYRIACKQCRIRPGVLWGWSAPDCVIINFPTKNHWREPSYYRFLDCGLGMLADGLKKSGPQIRVTIPALGCTNGGLRWEKVRELLVLRLWNLRCRLYCYEPLKDGSDEPHRSQESRARVAR